VQFRAKGGQAFSVAVQLMYSAQPLANEYFLYVTGSTNEFQYSDITGPHIVSN